MDFGYQRLLPLFKVFMGQGQGRKYKENGKPANDALEDLEHGQMEVSQSAAIRENTCRICWGWQGDSFAEI